MSNSVQPHRRQPTRLHHPWDPPGKNTGVGCHFPLRDQKKKVLKRFLSLLRTGELGHGRGRSPTEPRRQGTQTYYIKSLILSLVSFPQTVCQPLSSPICWATGSFLMSQFLAKGGQSIRASASASVLSMKIQD